MKKFFLLTVVTLMSLSIFAVNANIPLVLIHGFEGNGSSLNALESALKNDGFYFEKIVKPSYPSNEKIEKIVTSSLESQINLNEQGIFIADSMGGLVSRQYLLDEEHNVPVKALITIGTPNLGTGVADLWNWITFLLLDDVAIVAPPVVDTQPERGYVVADVSASILDASKGVEKLAGPFYFVLTDKVNNSVIWAWNLAIPGMATLYYAYRKLQEPCIPEMAPGSAYLKKINNPKTSMLPATGEQGKPIWYASIYGTKNNIFELMDAAGKGGKELKKVFGTISGSYTFWGAYYVLTGGWWNWTRTGDGLLYLVGAAMTIPYDQSQIYNNVLVGSSNTDAFIPVNSQKFPKNVVPNLNYYVIPRSAPDANHFTELKPTLDVNNDLISILKRAYGER